MKYSRLTCTQCGTSVFVKMVDDNPYCIEGGSEPDGEGRIIDQPDTFLREHQHLLIPQIDAQILFEAVDANDIPADLKDIVKALEQQQLEAKERLDNVFAEIRKGLNHTV